MASYTADQLETYLERIGYPGSGKNRVQGIRACKEADPLDTLSELQRRHLCSIPWGNSGLHYTQHHTISIHPQAIYDKLVLRKLDGYCMENSNLFYLILQSLGYQIYATGGRVSHAVMTGRNDGLFGALGHMILIVTIGNEKYMVDVGFGNNCATRPIPLKENLVVPHIAPSESRLIKESLPEFTDKTQKIWIYQTRYNPESEWMPNICFSEIEFLPQDFGVMNFFVSQNPASFFTQIFICMRMIMSEDEKEIEGQCVMSGREVKRRVRGKTEVVEKLESEEDRVRALEKWYGMHLREDEIQGIRGLSSMII